MSSGVWRIVAPTLFFLGVSSFIAQSPLRQGPNTIASNVVEASYKAGARRYMVAPKAVYIPYGPRTKESSAAPSAGVADAGPGKDVEFARPLIATGEHWARAAHEERKPTVAFGQYACGRGIRTAAPTVKRQKGIVSVQDARGKPGLLVREAAPSHEIDKATTGAEAESNAPSAEAERAGPVIVADASGPFHRHADDGPNTLTETGAPPAKAGEGGPSSDVDDARPHAITGTAAPSHKADKTAPEQLSEASAPGESVCKAGPGMLKLEKSGTVSVFPHSGPFAYRIDYTNEGRTPIRDLIIRDHLPVDQVFLTAKGDGFEIEIIAESLGTCVSFHCKDVLEPGESGSLFVTVCRADKQ